ncbi:MAG: hypothetical protein H3C68_06705 [Deltaproteobacteria bacterium]|nr:hypothetical protein [Deltaproteobacteria bacterium]MBZ0219554.1 hypothetical protein [Deltaproteobacteria bacterium]
MGLLDIAGGIEAYHVLQGENPSEAAIEARPDVVLADPETLAGILAAGFPEGARILLVFGEGEKELQRLFNRPVCGIIKKGSGGLALQTAIKAIARGVEWVECAPEGIEGSRIAFDGSPEIFQTALAYVDQQT